MNTIRRSCCLVALAVFAAAGCTEGKTVPLQRAETVPAAQGRVQAERTDQGNTRLEVEHLAPPPLEKFHVSITPEASPNAQTPTNEPIMSAGVATPNNR